MEGELTLLYLLKSGAKAVGIYAFAAMGILCLMWASDMVVGPLTEWVMQ